MWPAFERGTKLDRITKWARAGIWLLPAGGLLTFFATLTHQPDVQSRFADWSRYVTTGRFLASHLVGSIFGAAVTILGLIALASLLASTPKGGAAGAGLVLGVVGNVSLAAVFGIAASAQPAMGRAFLAGDASMQQFYDKVYDAPVLALAAVGVLLFSLSFILLGRSVYRSGTLPRAAGVMLAVGGPLIGIAGVIFGPAQTLGSILVVAGGVMIARADHDS